METQTDVLIVGGGPGGLACARLLAEQGKQVTLVDRKAAIGPKVCAGGITWSGLLQHVPEHLIERSFPTQHIHTALQQVGISEKTPIIATVNREKLGRWMKEEALRAGAVIHEGTRALRMESSRMVLRTRSGERHSIRFNHLVGADGANSMVRRHLGLRTERVGVGLNHTLPETREHMEWHLLPKRFGYGYAWIFPHSDCTSVGAYVERTYCSTRTLKENLIAWAAERGIVIDPDGINAGLVNFDYQGHVFGNTHLVGEAAGLASGLTGEGIYPAIVSGRATAKLLLDPTAEVPELESMIAKQKKHHAIIDRAKAAPLICGLLMNILVFMLRVKILDFRMLEMAD